MEDTSEDVVLDGDIDAGDNINLATCSVKAGIDAGTFFFGAKVSRQVDCRIDAYCLGVSSFRQRSKHSFLAIFRAPSRASFSACPKKTSLRVCTLVARPRIQDFLSNVSTTSNTPNMADPSCIVDRHRRLIVKGEDDDGGQQETGRASELSARHC